MIFHFNTGMMNKKVLSVSRRLVPATLVFVLLFAFSSCSNVPDHVKYIPKDAVVVVGINAKALGRKVAWNVITGSKLFKQWMKDLHDKNADNFDFGKYGVDGSNTFYLYIKGDKRYNNGNRVTALVPLTDAGNWEAYVKKQFPTVNIKQQGNRKEAVLTQGMYAGWNSKLLIVMNVLPSTDDMTGNTSGNAKPQMDEAGLNAEMQNAFEISDANTIMQNKRYASLQHEDHDVLFWMNYDLLMTEYVNESIAGKMEGISLSNTLWKDAAMTGGIDFDKGAINGSMRYYMSDSMKEAAKEMGGTNADKEMLERLPMQNLDMLMAWHLSPKGLKMTLEKAGLLGFANVALAQQGSGPDMVFDAFTGDIAVALNDFALKNETTIDSSMGEPMTFSSMKPSLNGVYAMKINKKENFDKLLAMITENGLLSLGNGAYAMPISETDSIFIISNEQYAIVSNKRSTGDAFMKGTYKGQKGPAEATDALSGHPFSFYVDIQQIAKSVDPAFNHSIHDSAIISESKRLLSSIMIDGGEYKNESFEYHMRINFMNKDENSLMQLMDFGKRVNDINNLPLQTAYYFPNK